MGNGNELNWQRHFDCQIERFVAKRTPVAAGFVEMFGYVQGIAQTDLSPGILPMDSSEMTDKVSGRTHAGAGEDRQKRTTKKPDCFLVNGSQRREWGLARRVELAVVLWILRMQLENYGLKVVERRQQQQR